MLLQSSSSAMIDLLRYKAMLGSGQRW